MLKTWGILKKLRDRHPVLGESGQMTIEFVVAFPVMMVIAVIAVNALLFFSDCAAFDRVARDAVRVHAASPAYQQGTEQSLALINGTIDSQLSKNYLSSMVSVEGDVNGYATFTATLEFMPNLFGMGLRPSIFGVSLPSLHHSTAITVDVYKPGVLL